MKIKSFMTMMVVATTFVFGMSSCSSDDDKTWQRGCHGHGRGIV